MICDMDPVYRPRNKRVRFYETETTSEWDSKGYLIGLAKQDLSDDLRDKIMELSPFIFEVFKSIQAGIRFQEEAQSMAKYESESREKRGQKQVEPGIWEYKNGIRVKEFGDYPVKQEEEGERR